MTTVISIPGYNFFGPGGYDTENFGGAIYDAPNTYIPGTWKNNQLSESSANDDMNTLNGYMGTYLPSPGERLVITGHSRGAQIIYKWLREMAPTSSYDPDDYLLVCAGCPERYLTGRSYIRTDDFPPTSPGPNEGGFGVGWGLPADVSGFRTLDITMQYDEWSDYPTDWTRTATADAIGNSYHTKYEDALPLGLDGWPVDWDDWTYWQGTGGQDTVTYMVSPQPSLVTPPAKSAMARLHGGKAAMARRRSTQALDAKNATRIDIETGYTNRVVPIVARVT